jgi:hypothetical protein
MYSCILCHGYNQFTKVAVSLLDDQTSSLVGVAISASLLPPAVNCGLLMTSWIFFKKNILADNTDIARDFADFEEDISNEDLAQLHSDFLMGAGISFLLTIANIVLIIFASILMFRLKEVRIYHYCLARERVMVFHFPCREDIAIQPFYIPLSRTSDGRETN